MANADRLIELFNEAKARPVGAERERFLAEACRDDPESKKQVVSLLQAHAGAGDFLKNVEVLPSIALQLPNIRYFGDYELLKEIARGGMGVVFEARQVSLNRTVAIKMILAGQLAGDAEVRRFRTEAEAAANLQHPNIVAIHEVGMHEGQHYFSMDFVDGKDLAAVIQGEPLPGRRAAELAKTMAEAIQYAHQRGILHRDLKPQNVLIDERGESRITDFGLAKRSMLDSNLTQSGAVMGSPSYMPPEQAAGRQDQVGPPSDVYSLGAILYEMLTGRPPFKGETAWDTLRQVVEDAPTRPTKLNQEVPRDLETVCLKCLEKQPGRRYASARALAEDLGRFLNQEPILARPVSAMREAEHWLRRHPWTLVGMIAAVLLGVLGVTYWLWQVNQFLRFVQSHPEYAPRKGPFSERLMWVFVGSLWAFVAGMWLMTFYNLKSRHLTWSQRGNLAAMHAAPRFSVARGLRLACLLAATAQFAFGVTLVLTCIDVLVWERARLFPQLSFPFAFALCCAGPINFWQIIRQQTAVAYGLPLEHPPAPTTNLYWDLLSVSERPQVPTFSFRRLAFGVLVVGIIPVGLIYFLAGAKTKSTVPLLFTYVWVLIMMGLILTRFQRMWVRNLIMLGVALVSIPLLSADSGSSGLKWFGGCLVAFLSILWVVTRLVPPSNPALGRDPGPVEK